MRKLLKQILYFTTPISFLILLLFFLNIILFDFKLAHQSSMVSNNPADLHKYFILSEIKDFTNSFSKKKTSKFKKIDLYVEEQKLKQLITKTPLSTKKWVNAKLNLDNEGFRNIQLRYRGDNPTNWMYKKKSFKIKTRKNNLINNVRSFDYLMYNAEKFAAFYLSKKMSLITQDAKISQVNLNGKNHGLYVELNKIDESFLRNNKIMPVNIYKGENHSLERIIGLNENLFNNPRLWTKVAFFNQRDLNDYSDLKRFLTILNNNQYNENHSINDYIDQDYFSKFEAFLTLTQNNHQDFFHNIRLISDPWNGKVNQLLTDPIIKENISGKPFLIDFASNDLSKVFNLKSNMIHKKYEFLYDYVTRKKIVEELEQYFLSIDQDLKIADEVEPYMLNRPNYIEGYQNLVKILKNNSSKITKILESNFENSSWSFNENRKSAELIVGQNSPLTDLKIKFKNNETPEWIGIDENFNGKIDKNEFKFFLKNGKQSIELPLILYSNRILKTYRETFIAQDEEISNINTRFYIISSNNKKPIKVISKNYFTTKEYEIRYSEDRNAVRQSKNNRILSTKLKPLPIIELSGELDIHKNKIFLNPVRILSGTVFNIHPGKHIIFRNKVEANGTKDNPIIFKKFGEKPWGSVVLLGKDTKKSYLKHINFQGGSGGTFNQYSFTSMFSLHNVEDIKIYDCKFISNSIYDDTIHVVYSNNIDFNNIEVIQAFSDAIDIDVSKNIRLKNVNIINPGNDGIDLMESEANVLNLFVVGSKDKGISVGEKSSVSIKDSSFNKNFIGIAVKDNSKVKIDNSNFLENYYQLASYAKNWRYDGGGDIKIFNSNFTSEINRFTVLSEPGSENIDKDIKLQQDSSILIKDSNINGEILKQGDKISVK
jgi:hypothetical protein